MNTSNHSRKGLVLGEGLVLAAIAVLALVLEDLRILWTVPVTLVPFFILLRAGAEPPQEAAEEPEGEEQRDEQMENLRLRILMETMDVLYFQWDIQEGRLRASTNWKDTMGYEPTIALFEEGELVDEPERLSFIGMVMQVQGGEAFAQDEFHFHRGDSYRWGRIWLVGFEGDDGEIRYILGILKDTEEEKQRVSALRTTAMLDPLTQVLNKSATRDEIAMRLGMSSAQSESHNAFLLYDIDNFKQVNDTHGHMVGDEVLVKVANTLKESFRVSDQVGRIGGDEFVVYMKEFADPDDVTRRVSDSMIGLHKICLPDGSPITMSVGAAIAPKDGRTYEELYRNADRAMYVAKREGRDTWHFYDGVAGGRGSHYDTLCGDADAPAAASPAGSGCE